MADRREDEGEDQRGGRGGAELRVDGDAAGREGAAEASAEADPEPPEAAESVAWARDPRAVLDRLFVDEAGRLARILAKFRIPVADADDLLSEAYLQVWRKRDEVRQPASWLRGALRNECRMYWRGRSRSFVTPVDEAILELVAEGSAPMQEREVLRGNLRRWIRGLDRRCREVLHLRYHLGFEPREVADELGYKPSSIDKITRRCLDALGRKVAAAQPAPDVKTKSRPGSAPGGR